LNHKPEDIGPEEMKSNERMGDKSKVAKSLIITPMIIHERAIGAMGIYSYSFDVYQKEHADLLTGAANQIAVAIENARLYSELQKELRERKRAEEEVRLLNSDLESRVQQRTAELEAVNTELASFTYTISHDLRAPLRGIHGLAHIILDEYGHEISPNTQQYIHRIQENARYMGQLIDDLLLFTHLGRQQLRRSSINMTELVEYVFNDLTRSKSRDIRLNLNPLPAGFGDRALVKQAISNLLSNAIKFTRQRKVAQIEVGATSGESETTYFVRDNGVGFNMSYETKLFGVFQRLHHQHEFEGTGVGLAIVKRIIQRHGGRVWAEGQMGKGATFYFTLPMKGE
jgi:light-regulated signal transduction histidine kinase (bacteriophytochrome)